MQPFIYFLIAACITCIITYILFTHACIGIDNPCLDKIAENNATYSSLTFSLTIILIIIGIISMIYTGYEYIEQGT